ncbi:predicted protein [Histoplasma capsulatum G186AR]|uniref:Uncharacterized protein n=2 Tax=Ajellomyces capsulatus TaxID=5037 RepID=C0NG70_AJECG|nr:uncharacterized protein HCBG_01886 [Histoplasma capsulatum G186AR]EEH10241.1 predicted protein [Histoplasma capsulatum G186AR]KAG5290800.1 hypothetical protein I7I52_07932 [Histoplasma capsulatum]QSS72728.1 hypothetical protein I7I50_00664 [Histoplasma capsulatum G186AR]
MQDGRGSPSKAWQEASRGLQRQPDICCPATSYFKLRSSCVCQKDPGDGLDEVPEIHSSTTTTVRVEDESKEGIKVTYCYLVGDHSRKIYELTEGEEIANWVQGQKRYVWVAHSMKGAADGKIAKVIRRTRSEEAVLRAKEDRRYLSMYI